MVRDSSKKTEEDEKQHSTLNPNASPWTPQREKRIGMLKLRIRELKLIIADADEYHDPCLDDYCNELNQLMEELHKLESFNQSIW